MRKYPSVFAAGTIALALSMMPVAATAAIWDILRDDIDAFEKESASIQTDIARDEELYQAEQSPELFYALPGWASGEKSVVEERRDDRTDAFVSAVIGGKAVIFRDVPRDTWFAPYVRSALERGTMSGYRDAAGNPLGEFGPANDVTVEEVAKVALLMSGRLTADCPKAPKNITASGSWSSAYIACAEYRGWVLYSDATVDVKRPALRSEVIATLLQAYDVQPGDPTGTAFTDVEASRLYSGAIEQAKKDGVVSGYTDASGEPTGLFGPDDRVRRAEFSKMITIAADIYGGVSVNR